MMSWNFSQRAVTSLWDTAIQPIQDWLARYPVMVWLLEHPFWLLSTLLFCLFLLAGLLRAVARLTEQLWLALLRLPLTLVQWIWRGTLLLWRPVTAKSVIAKASLTESACLNSSSRLTEVLERLEVLRQEEQELMQEMKTLLRAQQDQ